MEKEDNNTNEEHLLMNPKEMEKDDNIKENKKNKNQKETENNNKIGLEEEEENNDEIEGFKNEIEEIKIERLKGENNTYDRSIKVILIGDPGVGKSNILSRLINNKFEEKYNPSLSLEYSNHTIKINNYIIRMQIWDAAGQEKKNSIISNYYKSAEVAVFVYSINDNKSFTSIQESSKELINENNDENNNVKKVLLGNKLDLEKERQVEYKTAETFAKENGFEVFGEITCKNDEQQDTFKIGNIFDAIGKLFYDEFMQSRDSYNMSSFHYLASNSILESRRNTQNENPIPEKKKCCPCCCCF